MSLPNHAQLVKELRDLSEMNAEEHNGLLAILGNLTDRITALEARPEPQSSAKLHAGEPFVLGGLYSDEPMIAPTHCGDCGSLLDAGHFDSCPLYEAPSAQEPILTANG